MDKILREQLDLVMPFIMGILFVLAFPFMLALTPLMIGWKVFKWVWFGSKLF